MPHSSSHRPLKPRLFFVLAVIALITGLQIPRLMRSSAADKPAGAAGLVTGLTLTFESADGKTVDARDARLVSLAVPAGTPPSSLLPRGPFRATWTGVLTSKIKDESRFAALGRGDLTVTLNDQKVLDLHGDFSGQPSQPITLHKGKTRIVVTYKSPPDGDASVRLLWAKADTIFDPIPPNVFMHDPAEEIIARHDTVRAGRELLVTMRCAACHAGISGSIADLKQDAPNLTAIGDRLNRKYVAAWITNPRAIRPTSSMPRIFTSTPANPAPSVDPQAADIAAYLCPTPRPAAPDVTDTAVLTRGARVYTGLGCIACHVTPGVDDSDPTLNRIPLKYVRAEFAPGQLVAYLRQPEAHYGWSKMPNFHLTDDEVIALSAWLVSRCPPDALPAAPAGDPVRGKKLFETAGCLSCHNAQGSPTPPPAAPDLATADWSRGCAANGPKGVDFGFTDTQKDALKAVAGTDWKPTLNRDPGPEFAARQIAILRCTACHEMDGHQATWSTLDSERMAILQDLPARTAADPEPKGDQTPPRLTWAGEKLQPSWMADFIAGKVPYKPRQWMYARMPSFPARAEGLSAGLSLTHGVPATDEVRPPADPSLADIGKSLAAQGRWECNKCHSVGDQPAYAPYEAEAPNFAHVSARLRHDYFSRWMDNPQYFFPGTKMMTFANGGGKTPYTDVLNGDAAAQFEALWNYLLAGSKIQPP
jgi:cytochrome c553